HFGLGAPRRTNGTRIAAAALGPEPRLQVSRDGFIDRLVLGRCDLELFVRAVRAVPRDPGRAGAVADRDRGELLVGRAVSAALLHYESTIDWVRKDYLTRPCPH